jgi:hypothetical protein
MFHSKEYIEYPIEGIAYTLNFLGLCNILTRMLTKTNHDLKYCLSKQFQIPCTTLILFLPFFLAMSDFNSPNHKKNWSVPLVATHSINHQQC